MLSAHQPAYLPWLGYFDKIRRSDVFVILDDVQFSARSKDNYVNRNRVKGPAGAEWLTVPVQMSGHMDKRIGDMLVAGPWRMAHFDKLTRFYSQAPYGHLRQAVLPPEAGHLCDVSSLSVIGLVGMLMPEYAPRIKMQSELGLPPSSKTQLIVDLCKATGQKAFLFGSHGRDYADLDLLRENGIEPVFQDYEHPSYPQQWGGWIPNLSVVDAILNVGIEGTRRLLCL